MILMNNFSGEPLELRNAMLAATKRVIESGWYVLGHEVERFEKDWAEICGSSYGVGVGNGLDAIEISLLSLSIGPGDEVITTSLTAFATVLAIIKTGATPILADIDETTGLMSIESAERCVSAKTKAVVLVHLYGQIKDMGNWTAFCKRNKVKLIEDCAQSHLAKWHGVAAGSFGDVGAFSFYPTKNLGTVGDAGMVVTDNKEVSEKARQIRNYGQSKRYYHPVIGMNSRLDELQAAILNEKVKFLRDFNLKRQFIAEIYHSRINNDFVLPLKAPNEKETHVYHLFVVRCNHRDELQSHLDKNGVQSLIHYPVPIHKQKSCLNISRDPKGLVNCNKFCDTILSIPCNPHLSEVEISTVVEVINSFRM